MQASEINTKNWQLSVTEPGEIVTDLADIDQCVRLIMGTQRGSDPVLVDFGVDLLAHVDKPTTQILPSLVKDVTDQLRRYEPRANILSVSGTSPEMGYVLITVVWEYANVTESTKFNYKTAV